MKKRITNLCFCLGLLALGSGCNSGNTSGSAASGDGLDSLIASELAFAAGQALLLDSQCPDTLFPRTFEQDSVRCSRSGWWTTGFFPGELWYLYEASGDTLFRNRARARTAALTSEQYNRNDHDLGFKLYNSFGNGLRLTGDSSYTPVLLQGATSLLTRFHPSVGLIMSWNPNPGRGWDYPVIIDNMMNLELLFWASRASGNPVYAERAIAHADKTLANHFREDNSSYHVVSYDSITGQPQAKETAQGYSNASAWARGQAWGLYGYTMAYRETGFARYLEQATRIADFILQNPNLPEDKVPYWDFDTPDSLKVYRDVSAAAITCSALIELSRYVAGEQQQFYLDSAVQILRSLAAAPYRAEKGENGGFLLKHSVGSIPHGSEVDVPLSYADYYFVESLLRLKRLRAGEEVVKQ